jgi:nicotinate-nucleotide adenylyltransferase
MIKTGLFFGSFNPIHIGHLAIANYMVEFTDITQVWFVVSGQNPLKKRKALLADYHRLALVNEAIDGDARFKASDIELKLPTPSYTVDTLAYLKEKYPDRDFVIIMGSDGLPTFNKWKNYTLIEQSVQRYIYPRPNVALKPFEEYQNCVFTDAPLIDVSSSFVRESIKNKKDVRYFLNDKVFKYIAEMHFYEK